MISDFILRIVASAFALYLGYLTIYCLTVLSDREAAWCGAAFTLLSVGIAFAAHRRLIRLKEERGVFLSRFEGRSIGEAISMASAEGRVLPRGLVAEKVKIPFQQWSAYELSGFQFVLASDEQGRARAFPISS
jgi:hypothetical protein